MVKTRSDLKGVRVATKAPRKMPASSSRSTPGRSSRKYEGGNSVCPRETPPWQKEITKFFSTEPNAGINSQISSEPEPGSSSSSQTNES